MKYTNENPPLKCLMRQSTCYKGTYFMNNIKGILVHSTGANNPNLKRYVQPDDNAIDRIKLIELLGKNTAGNDWNHISMQAGVNAWIGKLADGSITTVQTMPWSYRPWGCGKGKKGTCNDAWIQFEICEADLNDKEYFNKIYQETIELIAYLCKVYNIDPKGSVQFNGVTVPTILCHKDSYNLGLGSGHSDILHWFPKHGKYMDNIRNDVYKLLNEEEEEVTQEEFNQKMDNWLAEQAKKETNADWSAAARNWAESYGYIKGDEHGRKMYKKFLTREEFITVLYRILGLEK